MITLKNIRENIRNHRATAPEFPGITLMGDTSTEPNRTHVFGDPEHRNEGTTIAVIETTFEHLKDTWAVRAYVEVSEPYGYMETVHPFIRFDLSTVYNITKRVNYGYNPRLSPAQHKVATTALLTVCGIDANEDTPHVKLTRTELHAMILARIAEQIDRDNGSTSSPEWYAEHARNIAERTLWDITRYRNGNTVYGIAHTPEQIDALRDKALKAHKRLLTARAKAL